jgi:hypothetical protein
LVVFVVGSGLAAGAQACAFWDMGSWNAREGQEASDGAIGVADAGAEGGEAEGPAPIARDTFTREVATGLGRAEVGGDWTATSGGDARASVHGGAAQMTGGVGTTVEQELEAVSARDVDATVTVSCAAYPDGPGVYLSMFVRASAGDGAYYAVTLRMSSSSSDVPALEIKVPDGTVLKGQSVPDVPRDGGRKLHLRVRAVGASPTHVEARLWVDGQPEASGWTVQTDDATKGPQSAGAIGMNVYVSGSATSGSVANAAFDDLLVTAAP